MGLPRVPEFAVILAAGSIEGALLGSGQAVALTRLQLPRDVLRRWPVVTSVAAALAWSIGLLPSSIARIPWSSLANWLVAVVLGSALLLSIPVAQYSCRGALDLGQLPRLAGRHLLDLRAFAVG
jgi:hypothetical protein